MTPEHKAKIRAALLARGAGKTPTKTCPRCDQTKPRSEFGVRKNGYTKSWCHPCEAGAAWNFRPSPEQQKATNYRTALRRYHGITPEQYDALAAAQDGTCAICHRPPPEGKRLHIDHDHKTKSIRGLLCVRCNLGLGYLSDSTAVLEAALAYLLQEPSGLTSVPGCPSGVPRRPPSAGGHEWEDFQ